MNKLIKKETSTYNKPLHYSFLFIENEDMPPYRLGDVLLLQKNDIHINDIVVTSQYTIEKYRGQDILGKIIIEHTKEYVGGVIPRGRFFI